MRIVNLRKRKFLRYIQRRWVDRVRRWIAFDGKCHYCAEETPFLLATRDHRKPKSCGGKEDSENLVMACWVCNMSKGRMSEAEFLAMQVFDTKAYRKLRKSYSNSAYHPLKCVPKNT